MFEFPILKRRDAVPNLKEFFRVNHAAFEYQASLTGLQLTWFKRNVIPTEFMHLVSDGGVYCEESMLLYDSDPFLRFTGFKEMAQQSPLQAWHLATRKLVSDACEQCGPANHSIWAHRCWMSDKDAFERFGREAHSMLGLPEPSNMDDVLKGLATIFDTTTDDIFKAARKLATGIDYISAGYFPELEGFVYNRPIRAAVRLVVFKRLRALDPIQATRKLVEYLNDADCMECNPIYYNRISCNHTCMRSTQEQYKEYAWQARL